MYIVIALALLSVVTGNKDSVNNNDLEIERKWVINESDIPYDLDKADKFDITQTYINYAPEIRVRQITHKYGTYYTMTVKRYINDDALTRTEYDFDITKEEYEETVEKGIDTTIHKTRYQMDIDGTLYAFDIFHDELDGLAYMEIEFNSEDEANKFKEPSWVIKEVTNDRGYKNQSLAKYGMPD